MASKISLDVSAQERFVLIDTDAGLDDTMAILMCLQAHKNPDIRFRVVGITCVGGNTKVDNVTQNVTRVLEIMNEPEIPIFRGCAEAMVTSLFENKVQLGGIAYHGSDGFGDSGFPTIKPKLEPDHAVNAIGRLAHQYTGKLTILAMGPLTNLAMAVRMDPSIKSVLKDIYLMGGNVGGSGNCSITSEFNFAFDPEAAFVTLSAYKCPIVILPMELARDKVVQTFDWRLNELGALDTTECRLINKIEANAFETRHKKTGQWTSYDSTASAALIEPKIITKVINHYCTVELQGIHTRGQMIVDYRPHLQEPENIFIVTDMDSSLFQKMMKWAFGGPRPV